MQFRTPPHGMLLLIFMVGLLPSTNLTGNPLINMTICLTPSNNELFKYGNHYWLSQLFFQSLISLDYSIISLILQVFKMPLGKTITNFYLGRVIRTKLPVVIIISMPIIIQFFSLVWGIFNYIVSYHFCFHFWEYNHIISPFPCLPLNISIHPICSPNPWSLFTLIVAKCIYVYVCVCMYIHI